MRTLQVGVAVMLVLGSLAAVTWLPHLRIATVEIVGAEGTSAQTIKSFVSKKLEGSYMYVFPKDNIFLYPKEEIIENILAEFPTISNVEAYAENFQTLAIKVTERTPKALWCGESPENKLPCLLIDEKGVAYQNAAEFSGPVYVEYYGNISQDELPQQYLSADEFRSLAALTQALRESQSQIVTRVWVDEEKDVYAKFSSNFVLIFNLADDGGDIYERFVLAQTAEPFVARSLADFEYLDLRFGDRLYYKLKGE